MDEINELIDNYSIESLENCLQFDKKIQNNDYHLKNVAPSINQTLEQRKQNRKDRKNFLSIISSINGFNPLAS